MLARGLLFLYGDCMNPCQETKPDMAPLIDISQVPVIELGGEDHLKLPIQMQIGFCLLADEALLQHTGFPLSDRNGLPEILAAQMEFDTSDKEIMDCVRNGIKSLHDNGYLDFHRLELPVPTKDYKGQESGEVWELHLQPILTSKFDDLVRGSFESVWAEFSPDKD